MKDLQVNARFKVNAGKMDEFKQTAHACVESVKSKDTGTLQYDWFYNDSRSECIVRERYASSEAVLEHVGNLGELFGQILGLSEVSFEVFGNPSQQLVDALKDFDVTYYEFEEGI